LKKAAVGLAAVFCLSAAPTHAQDYSPIANPYSPIYGNHPEEMTPEQAKASLIFGLTVLVAGLGFMGTMAWRADREERKNGNKPKNPQP
jgi:hypothetical protein